MTDFQNFQGEARPLDRIDVPKLAHRIAVGEDHFQAFINVEAAGRGYGRDGRPIILNEPHVFYRNLSGAKRDQAVARGLAYRRWGEKPYPRTQAERYEWLAAAIEIDEAAGLKSCSWGASQVLGENFSLVGYETVQAMVLAFMDDEEEHIEAMMKYILATGIADDLREERWEIVARVYNGPGYKRNGYHTKMAREFRKLRGIDDIDWAPDRPDPSTISITDAKTLKAVQRQLHVLGYPEVGKVDGIYGTKLRAGVLAYRADNGLPIVADIDQQFLAHLMSGQEREVSEERASTTVAEIRDAGSRQIDSADKTQVGGGLLGAGGLFTAISGYLGVDDDGTFQDAWATVEPVVDLLTSNGPIFAAGLGAYIIYQAWRNKSARVQDEREGKHVGRS
jgi:hypothetical protein